MIQDIYPKKLSNTYQAKKPGKGSLLMVFRENLIFVKKRDDKKVETAEFLSYEDMESCCQKAEVPLPEMVYLFSIGKEDYFLTNLPGEFFPDCGKPAACVDVVGSTTGRAGCQGKPAAGSDAAGCVSRFDGEV